MSAFRRTLALLLALIMMLSAGVTSAAATEAPAPLTEQNTLPEAVPEEVPPALEAAEPAETETSEEAPEATEAPDVTATPEATEAPASEVPPSVGDGLILVMPVPNETAGTPEEDDTEASDELEEAEEPEETEHKQWPWTEPGNAISSILGGGSFLTYGERFYYSEDGLWLSMNGSDTLLANVDAANLNLSGGKLYYTVGKTVYRMDQDGGTAETVHTAAASILQMYVMGDELRYIAGGAACSYDMENDVLETLEAPSGLLGLIPTEYGNLYLTGSVFNYTLWAEMDELQSGLDSCYPDGEWLVVVKGGETLQTSLSGLFDGRINLASYNLHQDELVTNGLSDEEQLANEAAFLDSAEYAEMQEYVEAYDGGIMLMSTSHALTKTLTANQQNIILRAQQMAEVLWTPLYDRYAWGGNSSSYLSTKSASYVTDINGYSSPSSKKGIFLAGHTYKGIPYSQAVYTGYVGWSLSIKSFLNAVNSKSSAFYSGYSTYSKTAPYYGSDCSGFVSWAWDLPQRCTCSGLLNYSKYISKSVSDLQIGDAINNPSTHVMLVTDIGYDANGNIVSVEITEQTPSKMRVTCYGPTISGKTYDNIGQLSTLQKTYLNNGYSIYRRSCSSRPNVSEPSDDAGLSYAAAPTMSVAAAAPGEALVTLDHEKGSAATIYYTTDGSAPSTSSTKYTGPFTVTTEMAQASDSKVVTIRAIAVVTGYKNYFPLTATVTPSTAPTLLVAGDMTGTGVYASDGVYYFPSGKSLTMSADAGASIYYTTDGTEPTLESTKLDASKPIQVSGKATIKAFAVTASGIPSKTVTFQVDVGSLHTITVNDPFGFISPSGTVSVLDGKDVTFTITAKEGYTLADIKVDGKSIGTPKSYTFKNVTEDGHTISAEVDLPFSDVTNTKWYVNAVAFAYAKNLVNGIETTVNGVKTVGFYPNNSMTRAQFITILGRFANPGSTIANWSGQMGLTNGSDIYIRTSTTTDSSSNYLRDSNSNIMMIEAAGQYIQILSTVSASQSKDGGVWYQVKYNGKTGYVRSAMTGTNGKTLVIPCKFSDLTTSAEVSYCNGYAQWAYLNGIVNGTDTAGTKFSPGNNISRQDICVILYNYLTKYMGISLPTTGGATFNDSKSITDYAKDAVTAMTNIGIISGDEQGNFRPLYAATRAEVATMFMRLYEYLNG